jgi:hypothetical protein
MTVMMEGRASEARRDEEDGGGGGGGTRGR